MGQFKVDTSIIRSYIADNKKQFEEISKFIWEHPKTRFEEIESSDHLAMHFQLKGPC